MNDWVVIATMISLLLLARKLPEIAGALRHGLSEFGKALDELGFSLGRSAGGIFGKRAAQALTPDNQVAERYHPFAPRPRRTRRLRRKWSELWSRYWRWLKSLGARLKR